MRVQLGNPAPKGMTGRRVTTVDVPDSYTFLEKIATIVAADGVWNNHSAGDNVDDVTPEWVDSDDATVSKVLAEHFGCREKRPRGWAEELDGGDVPDSTGEEGAPTDLDATSDTKGE